MPEKYTREQLRQLYIKLPEEIKEVASADETMNAIEEVCARNDITDGRVGTISDLIRNVLFGLLPPEDFQKELEKEIGLKKDAAKKVAQEISRFIFYPVKPALEQLYSMSTAKSEGQVDKSKTVGAEVKPATPSQPVGKDAYREPIE